MVKTVPVVNTAYTAVRSAVYAAKGNTMEAGTAGVNTLTAIQKFFPEAKEVIADKADDIEKTVDICVNKVMKSLKIEKKGNL